MRWCEIIDEIIVFLKIKNASWKSKWEGETGEEIILTIEKLKQWLDVQLWETIKEFKEKKIIALFHFERKFNSPYLMTESGWILRLCYPAVTFQSLGRWLYKNSFSSRSKFNLVAFFLEITQNISLLRYNNRCLLF